MTYWQTPHFKALQKAWYQRLKDEGFDDQEILVGTEFHLKPPPGRKDLKPTSPDVDAMLLESKAAYFNMVAQKVEETAWTSAIDRLILLRHAEGKKIKHICEELLRAGAPRCRGTIRFRIRVYQMRWGIRHYTAKQLNYLKTS